MSLPLPPHARLLGGDDLWLEGDAIEQVARVASLPDCLAAAAMPDLHPGRGIPVGAAFAFRGAVRPELIGGDAGCGARLVATFETRGSLDALERRVRAALDDDPLADTDPLALLDAVFTHGVHGLAALEGIPSRLATLAASEPVHPTLSALPPCAEPAPFRDPHFAAALGTVGGGNHFVEISRVDTIYDPAAAAALGLHRNTRVVLAHSGSRGLGGALARHWGPSPRTGEEASRYLSELAGACRFAAANRFLLAYRLLSALGAAKPGAIAGGFDVVHNDVSAATVGGQAAWVHRKGAAPARAEEPTVVLGSRGAPSWVLLGTGAEASLASVAHGAGRRMGRSEAREKLSARYTRRQAVQGGRVLCDDPALLFEEHPDAYKPIGPVIDALLAHGAARPVATLVPLLTVKR